MEAKTEFPKMKVNSSRWLLPLLSTSALLFISGVLKAGDSTYVNPMITHADSMLADSLKREQMKGIHGIDDGGVLTYSLIVVGIIVIIGFAFFSSMKKNKPNPGAPVGYRKPNQHKHNHKI